MMSGTITKFLTIKLSPIPNLTLLGIMILIWNTFSLHSSHKQEIMFYCHTVQQIIYYFTYLDFKILWNDSRQQKCLNWIITWIFWFVYISFIHEDSLIYVQNRVYKRFHFFIRITNYVSCWYMQMTSYFNIHYTILQHYC